MDKIAVLFRKHKKKLPGILAKLPGGDYCRLGLCIAVSAWCFQGMRYMNWREAVLKLALDIIGTGLGMLWMPWYWALPIVHTLNFTFNGQLFAMFTHMGANTVKADFFLRETLRVAEDLKKRPAVGSALAFGSLARGEYKRTSDIDLRIVPRAGEWNFWKCVFWAFAARCRAFLRGYPLDLYVFDLPALARKMRSDEPPVLLAGQTEGLDLYPRIVSLEKFKTVFQEKQGLSA